MLNWVPSRGRRMTLGIAILTMLVSMLGSGGGLAAAQEAVIERSTTINALAAGTFCTSGTDGTETCTTVELDLSPAKVDPATMVVCIAVGTSSAAGQTYETGCADVTATFAMDREDLGWATLAPTSVDLIATVCSSKTDCEEVYSRTVALAASWVPAGDIERVHDLLGDPHGSCTQTDNIDGFVRTMTATVTLDGVGGEMGGNLQVLDSMTLTRTNCG